MMINGRTTVRTDKWEYDIDVTFQVPLRRVEIVIPFTSAKSLEVADFLYAKIINSIVIVDEVRQEFTAYECLFISRTTKMETITMLGHYKTLIKGRNIPEAGVISFHFEGLEHFFNQFSEFRDLGLLQKENSWGLLNNDGTIDIVAKTSDVDGIDALIAPLVKVREYFEFLIDKEIYVDRVVYSDGVGTSLEILNDRLLMSQNDCFVNEKCLEKPEEILKGINQWLLHYEPYKEVIHIWRKTIYNRQVSDEDVFIWRCQSLELLCTLYEPLLVEAKQQMENPSPKAAPNLSHFMQALNIKRKFIECDKSYFNDVKHVRNVYTHYNPKKHVSERQWWNSSHLIKSALKIALGYVMELDVGDAEFFFLMPPGTNEERRR